MNIKYQSIENWDDFPEQLVIVLMPTSHIQRSPAEIVDRPNVAEFQIRQGVERIFAWNVPYHILDGARAVPFEN